MSTNTTTPKQTFHQYVLTKLPVSDFNTLAEELGVTKSMITRRLANPQKMDCDLIEKFAKVLNVSVKFLYEEFRAGDVGLKISEYEELTKENKLPITD